MWNQPAIRYYWIYQLGRNKWERDNFSRFNLCKPKYLKNVLGSVIDEKPIKGFKPRRICIKISPIRELIIFPRKLALFPQIWPFFGSEWGRELIHLLDLLRTCLRAQENVIRTEDDIKLQSYRTGSLLT